VDQDLFHSGTIMIHHQHDWAEKRKDLSVLLKRRHCSWWTSKKLLVWSCLVRDGVISEKAKFYVCVSHHCQRYVPILFLIIHSLWYCRHGNPSTEIKSNNDHVHGQQHTTTANSVIGECRAWAIVCCFLVLLLVYSKSMLMSDFLWPVSFTAVFIYSA
jgi:hypothetical protein